MSRSSIPLCFLFLSGVAAAQQYIISTVAGGAPLPTPATATTAAINQPFSVATDTTGNVYFGASYCIFKLDTSGVLTRVAGNGRPGYSGDGGPATSAQLSFSLLAGLAVDGQGNIFIADNSRVRRVSPSGTITTVASNGIPGASGDGGPATNAQLVQSSGVAVDAQGNLSIADDTRIRKVSPAGIATTVAGTGTSGYSGDGGPATSAQLYGASGVALDGHGNLFIADLFNYRIRKVSADGIITTVAGGGTSTTGDGAPATSAELFKPQGAAVDAQGNIFIVEEEASRIRKVSPSGIISTVGGNGRAGYSGDSGPATSAQIFEPWAVAVDGQGNIFVADAGNRRVREISTDGNINTVAGGGSINIRDGSPATSAPIGVPTAVAIDPQGNFFISDQTYNRVWKVSPAGSIATAAGSGTAGYSGDGGPATSAQIWGPTGVAVDSQGNLFISDSGNDRIRKVSPGGIITTVAGNGGVGYSGDGGPATSAQLWAPEGLATDGQNNLFIADTANSRIRKVSPGGIITTVAGAGGFGNSGDGGPAISAQLDFPSAVAVDQQGNIFIADLNNDRIRKVSPTGTITTVAGNGQFGYSGDGGPATAAQLFSPQGIAVDALGNLYIADTTNLRIRKVSPGGIITTIGGGGGQQGYSGDGGPATNAQLASPYSLSVDGQGNLFISDDLGYAVRRLQPTSQSVLLTAVVDAASEKAGPISPGKIVVLYGAGLGPAFLAQNQPENGVYTSQLAGTSVYLNGTAAPILYTSAAQAAAIVPYGVTGTAAQVTVSYQGETSPPITVALAAAAPSLFTLNQTGAGQAAAINAIDGSINTAVNPVKIGGYISLFATGEGQTTPAGIDGKIASGPILPQPSLQVSATVGGLPAVVQYAGAAPSEVAGLMQINLQLPSGIQPGGYVPVILQVGNASTVPGAVWIAVAGN